jgi:hypothetical protein
MAQPEARTEQPGKLHVNHIPAPLTNGCDGKGCCRYPALFEHVSEKPVLIPGRLEERPLDEVLG